MTNQTLWIGKIKLWVNKMFFKWFTVLAKSLIQLAEEEKLSSFLQLVRFAGLEDALENFGEYTVFAPSEAAMFCKSMLGFFYQAKYINCK